MAVESQALRTRPRLLLKPCLKAKKASSCAKRSSWQKPAMVQMLKVLVVRILPKERSVRIDLPLMERSDDAVDALGAIINGVANGEITPGEGAALATLVEGYARAINVHELESRLDTMERELRALKAP